MPYWPEMPSLPVRGNRAVGYSLIAKFLAKIWGFYFSNKGRWILSTFSVEFLDGHGDDEAPKVIESHW